MIFLNKIKKTKFAHNCAVFVRHRQIDYYNSRILPRIIDNKKGKEKLDVAFIVYNVSMWKYNSLFEAMLKDDRFNPFIVLTPSPGKEKSIRDKHLIEMKKEFDRLNYKVYPNVVWNNLEFDSDFKADIVFLAQMYIPNLLTKEMKKYLFCYCPYGFPSTSSSKWAVDTFLHNIAWKEFQVTQLSIDDSAKVMYNKAENRVLTGYVFGDELLKQSISSEGIWKNCGKEKKKIIWAPHFSIDPDHNFHLSNFLNVCDIMFDIAKLYKDDIQIAFKPHPFLYSTLCQEKFWGKEKTDLYYNNWKNLDNGQLEEGSYADLFSTSDAIIHDCGSFTIEYLYTGRPAMYLIETPENRETDSLGKEALNCYYYGVSRDKIEFFIRNVVILGNDELYNKRKDFFNKYLKVNKNSTVADAILNEIKKNL